MKLQATLSNNSKQIYALMRIVVGLLFFSHGFQKMESIISGRIELGNSWLFYAGIIEFVCGLMIILGWQTFIAAFISSGEMAVAYFTSHQPKGIFPIDNGGEKAVFYCFVFLFIAAIGSGIWSIDKLLHKK